MAAMMWRRSRSRSQPSFLAWMARDLCLMFARQQRHGMLASPEAVARMTELLGHTPRTYRDFAAETAKAWQS